MHIPVLLSEVMELLDPAPGDVILDATLGGGGHAARILERILPGGRLLAIDRDPEAIRRVKRALLEHETNIAYFNDDFRRLSVFLEEEGVASISGALFDLGISSYQVDDAERGFSFLKEGPLDMRFDKSEGLSASEVVNTFSKNELEEIIKSYGEERYSHLVARAILQERKKRKITRTDELAEIISKSIGGKYRHQKLHPACRTFQALRIYVNDELGSVEEGVKKALEALETGGRICVISFHSLEDRIIKNLFRDNYKAGKVKLLTKKPIIPEREEVKSNPRSRSAKLRGAEKI